MSTLTDTPVETNDPPIDRRDRFETIFLAHSRAILGYALRRVPVAADAADVVAETFLVVWRRIDDVPADPDVRPWLYGVARLVLANHLRGTRRRHRLGERLRDDLLTQLDDAHPAQPATDVVHQALARLDDDDRELLRLTSWEELSPAELAIALDIPAATVRTRLHRARKRLRSELAALGWSRERQGETGHEGGDGHLPVRRKEES